MALDGEGGEQEVREQRQNWRFPDTVRIPLGWLSDKERHLQEERIQLEAAGQVQRPEITGATPQVQQLRNLCQEVVDLEGELPELPGAAFRRYLPATPELDDQPIMAAIHKDGSGIFHINTRYFTWLTDSEEPVVEREEEYCIGMYVSSKGSDKPLRLVKPEEPKWSITYSFMTEVLYNLKEEYLKLKEPPLTD